MNKEILDFVSQFTETENVHVHPLSCLMQAFSSEDTAAATVDRLQQFLQEAHQVHMKRFDLATLPASWLYWGKHSL